MSDAERLAELERCLRLWADYRTCATCQLFLSYAPASNCADGNHHAIHAVLHLTSPPPGQHGAEAETQAEEYDGFDPAYDKIATGPLPVFRFPPGPGHGGSIPPGRALELEKALRATLGVLVDRHRRYIERGLTQPGGPADIAFKCEADVRLIVDLALLPPAPETEQRAGVEDRTMAAASKAGQEYAASPPAPTPRDHPYQETATTAIDFAPPAPTPGEPRTVPGEGNSK